MRRANTRAEPESFLWTLNEMKPLGVCRSKSTIMMDGPSRDQKEKFFSKYLKGLEKEFTRPFKYSHFSYILYVWYILKIFSADFALVLLTVQYKDKIIN